MKAVMVTTKEGAKFLIDEMGDEIAQEDVVIKIISDHAFQNMMSKKVDVDIDISDEDFLTMAKMAHDKDITFNQMANNILREVMEKHESGRSKETPGYGDKD